ncbi:MAG: ABC transporter permease subunit, partial [Desulfohalobiaceae bacterium]
MLDLIAQSMPRLLQGTWVTIWLTVLAVSIGLTMAVPLSLALVAKSRAVRWPVLAFTFYFRGTPLLVQIFLIYFGSGQFRGLLDDMGLWTFFRDASFCA